MSRILKKRDHNALIDANILQKPVNCVISGFFMKSGQHKDIVVTREHSSRIGTTHLMTGCMCVCVQGGGMSRGLCVCVCVCVCPWDVCAQGVLCPGECIQRLCPEGVQGGGTQRHPLTQRHTPLTQRHTPLTQRQTPQTQR